jgi:ferredoxin-NADP reductase
VSFAPAVVSAVRAETDNARTLTLDVEHWPGHIAGQHVDIRLTAEDGYTAVRSYSIASSAVGSASIGSGSIGSGSIGSGSGSRPLEVTVDKLADGEVSPYLVDGADVGDRVEVRGPAGGWFVWPGTDDGPVQLIGGGSGIVPLMAMIRSHGDAGSAAPFRLLYSVRSPASALYYQELMRRAAADEHLRVDYAFTRATPPDWPTPAQRLTRATLVDSVFPPGDGAAFFVCGSTPFVESVATWLVEAGHPADRIKTERFGGIGVSP